MFQIERIHVCGRYGLANWSSETNRIGHSCMNYHYSFVFWIKITLVLLFFLGFYLFVCSFLAKRGVREDIATFEARNITPEIRQSVEELLNRNKSSFDPKVS